MRPTSLLKRFASPEEVASLVAYVASPLASATNGAALRVGWRGHQERILKASEPGRSRAVPDAIFSRDPFHAFFSVEQ